MTTGGILDLLDSSSLSPVIAQAGESINITATLTDADGSAIAEASLLTLTLTLYDEASASVINSRNDQSVHDTNGGIVTTAGALTMKLQPLDNVIVGTLAAGQLESHIARFKWTWTDGEGTTRTGITQLRYRVQKLTTVS